MRRDGDKGWQEPARAIGVDPAGVCGHLGMAQGSLGARSHAGHRRLGADAVARQQRGTAACVPPTWPMPQPWAMVGRKHRREQP
jgi:hypothetical protein